MSDRPIARRSAVAALGIALLAAGSGPRLGAAPLETLRVGKSIASSFPFGVLEVGEEAHIWESVGLKLDVAVFKGDGALQQGFAANAVDIGLGSGPAMGYHAKGVPDVAVAAMYGAPTDMALIVPKSSPMKSVADLKGKRIGVTTAGSLTDWLVHEMSRAQGWGNDGITAVPLGTMEARIAAMQNGDIAGTVQDASVGYALEEQNKGKVFVTFGSIAKFHTHVILASDDVIAKRPAAVAKFLKGWFKTVAYMKKNKATTVRVIAKVMNDSEAVIGKSYDTDMPSMSLDGTFDPASVEAVRKSLKELGIMDTEPDVKSMYVTRFVPVKP